jgi:hypothetical protein
MLTLDHFLILSERHPHRVMNQFQGYSDYVRPHEGIAQRDPCRPEPRDRQSASRRIVSRPVLGGLQHDYIGQADGTRSISRAA